MIKVSVVDEKITPAKKTIKLDGIEVDRLRFFDESGDITQQVLDELPDGVTQVNFKITVELPSEE